MVSIVMIFFPKDGIKVKYDFIVHLIKIICILPIKTLSISTSESSMISCPIQFYTL